MICRLLSIGYRFIIFIFNLFILVVLFFFRLLFFFRFLYFRSPKPGFFFSLSFILQTKITPHTSLRRGFFSFSSFGCTVVSGIIWSNDQWKSAQSDGRKEKKRKEKKEKNKKKPSCFREASQAGTRTICKFCSDSVCRTTFILIIN